MGREGKLMKKMGRRERGEEIIGRGREKRERSDGERETSVIIRIGRMGRVE